jgi:hypothetical protein
MGIEFSKNLSMTLIPSGTDTPSENSMNAGISVPLLRLSQ